MQTVNLDFVRGIMDEIDWKERLLMIKGQKGVGKTTLMTQRIMQTFGATIFISLTIICLTSLNSFMLKGADTYFWMRCTNMLGGAWR